MSTIRISVKAEKGEDTFVAIFDVMENGFFLNEYPDFNNHEKLSEYMNRPKQTTLIPLSRWTEVTQGIAEKISGYDEISHLSAKFSYISDVSWATENVTAHVNECEYNPLGEGLTQGYWKTSVTELKDRPLDEVTSIGSNQTVRNIIALTDELAKTVGAPEKK